MKTVKQIMAEGRAAYKNTRGSGLRDKLNPYTRDPNALYDEADDWRRGWDQAHQRRVFLYQVSFTEAGLAFLRETSKMKPNERYQITARGRDETEALLDFNRMCSVRLAEPLRPEHVVLKMIEGW